MSRCFTLLVGIGLAVSVQAQSLDGAWKGVLQAGPQNLNIVFHFEKGHSGKDKRD